MKNVFFKPRVGENYKTKGFNGVKLLILGESHYCGDRCEDCGKQSNNKCSDFTIRKLNEYFKYKKDEGEYDKWMNTYTRFTNVLFNDHVDNETLLNFWNSVVFYNYVQSCTEEPRSAPTNQQFEDSKEAFIEVLDEYKPDLIIVWGEQLWDKLPDIGCWGEENILDNANERFYHFKVGNKDMPAYGIYHPSTRYFTYEYSKYLKEAIRLVSKPE